LKRDDARADEIERRVGRLMETKSGAADEALVVLLQYSVADGAVGEDLLHEVTARGKRVLPYLL